VSRLSLTTFFSPRGTLILVDPGAHALVVTITSFAASVIGATVVLIAHIGFLKGSSVVHGWTALIYGAWALVIGRILMRLAQSGTSTLTMGIILSVAETPMLVTYHWIVDKVRTLDPRGVTVKKVAGRRPTVTGKAAAQVTTTAFSCTPSTAALSASSKPHKVLA